MDLVECAPSSAAFRHEALLYRAGADGFAAAVTPLVAATLDRGGTAAVAAPGVHVERLRDRFGADQRVQLIDMTGLGANPGRIIPAWRDLADRALAGGGPFLGVGEPVWADRSPEELDQCLHHEALINVAFADDPPWRLVCPYDVDALAPEVVERASLTHPLVVGTDGSRLALPRRDVTALTSLERPISPVPANACRLFFDRERLGDVRDLAGRHAAAAGLARERLEDVLLAVTELAANSVRHGGGEGVLSVWRRGRAVICQITDAGVVRDAMVGRRRPRPDDLHGRGIWLVHQLCDLVQIRSGEAGTTVRIRIAA